MQDHFAAQWLRTLLVALGAVFVGNMHVSLGAASPLAPEGSPEYLEPKLLTGSIYDLGPGPEKLLFTFKRSASATNSVVEALREYRLPDGSLAARERVNYDGNNLISFEVEQLQAGTKGTVLFRPDPKRPGKKRVYFEHRPKAGPTRVSSEELQSNVLINDMVAPFILLHWQELMRGAVVPLRFLATTRMETISLKLMKESQGTREGKKVVFLRMELANRLLAPFLKPLLFTIEAEGKHRILEYSGRTTPRIWKNGKWAELDGRTVFDWK